MAAVPKPAHCKCGCPVQLCLQRTHVHAGTFQSALTMCTTWSSRRTTRATPPRQLWACTLVSTVLISLSIPQVPRQHCPRQHSFVKSVGGVKVTSLLQSPARASSQALLHCRRRRVRGICNRLQLRWARGVLAAKRGGLYARCPQP